MKEMINIALPKGRLGEKVYNIFESLGYGCPSIKESSRKLIFEDLENGVRYFWVKPSDVAIYVEKGAADVGVVGKDILLEYSPDIYELLDLGIGKCKVCVAGRKGKKLRDDRTIRVATKFANIALDHYQKKGRDIEIIKLNGSIELAPLLNLSDVIVDIVETGATLKENNMHPETAILSSSARLIANKSAYRFKCAEIDAITDKLKPFIK